jgi:formylglycine-generating enzyme required for sulfatase activity
LAGLAATAKVKNRKNIFFGNLKENLILQTNLVCMQQPEIFISYAWGGESEKIVDILYNTFVSKGYNIVRDKVNLGYKGSITSFMDKIGQGKYVIVVISDKYIKSENCMYEIVQIAKNGQFHDRIFPIVLSDANFYKPVNRIKYIAHWENQKKELNESMKSLDDMSMIAEIQKELANYNDIHQNISNILFVLKDMNTLTPDIHQDTHFEALFKHIDDKIVLDNELNKNFKAADEELKNRIISQQNTSFAYDLFLSFSNKNKPEVEKTAATLRQYGLRVFVSNDSLAESIGKSFSDQINHALENSQHFILLCTPEAMTSKWVKSEHENFFSQCYDIAQNRRFFILKGTNFDDKILPFNYRNLQYVSKPTEIIKVLGIEVKNSPEGEYTVSAKAKTTELPKGNFHLYAKLVGGASILLASIFGLVKCNDARNQEPHNNERIGWPIQQKQTKDSLAKLIFDYEMVYVQGGSYQMGYDPNRDGEDKYMDSAKPLHSVKVGNFYMGKYEVTQAQWKQIMGNNPSSFENCSNCPIESVSWNDIQTFLKKLNQKTGGNYRLPTEEEWEYAARGGNQSNGYKYAGSNNIDLVGWYDGNSSSKTHRVGQKSPNELGIYDMTGNVWEWTNSGWFGNYEKNRTSDRYVLRGGSWFNYDNVSCRVAYRNYNYPTVRDINYGFRLVSPQ